MQANKIEPDNLKGGGVQKGERNKMVMAFGKARREGATRTENNSGKTEEIYTNLKRIGTESTML